MRRPCDLDPWSAFLATLIAIAVIGALWSIAVHEALTSSTAMKPDPAKSPKLSADALVVLGLLVLGVIAFSALWMGYDLVRMLIVKPMEPANLAVFVGLVGSITSICGTAIGFVGGAIFGARRQPSIGPITGDNASIGTGAAPSAAQPTGAESGNDSAATTGNGS